MFIPNERAVVDGLSADAAAIFHWLASGERVLLYDPEKSFLCPRTKEVPRKLEDVSQTAVEELRGSGLIAPLSRFEFNYRLGYLELVGEAGQLADVYVCRS